VRNNPREGRMASVMLLTDGTPNRNPDAGIMPTMEEYLTMPANLGMIAAINTFGFGYNLDSALLQQMAALGKGMYSFIPDSGFVGTAFIHSVANCLVSLGGPAEARLSTLGDVQSFGFLKYGFTRSVVMKAAAGADLGQAQLNLKMADGTPSCCTIPLAASQDQEKALKQARRMHFCNTLDVLLAEHAQQHNPEAALAVIEKLRIDLVAMGADETPIPHPVMPGDTVAKDPILADLNGQVREAFSRSDWFNKWGKHYLLSLLMAHRREECSNFKDIGLQSYALDQDVFDDLRDEGDAFFNDLPPPVPSRPASRGTAASAPRAPVNMAAYNNCAGPCFAGECLVAMGGGQPDRRVDSIKQGDLVQSADRTEVRVACVVRTECANSIASLVQLPGGLLVTPWHPVMDQGSWEFPIYLAESVQRPCEAVYSFVLETGQSMNINNVMCITLAHGITLDPVASHPFYGTTKVLEQLCVMPGWRQGLVQLKPGCIARDPTTGLACGFIQHTQPTGCNTNMSDTALHVQPAVSA